MSGIGFSFTTGMYFDMYNHYVIIGLSGCIEDLTLKMIRRSYQSLYLGQYPLILRKIPVFVFRHFVSWTDWISRHQSLSTYSPSPEYFSLSLTPPLISCIISRHYYNWYINYELRDFEKYIYYNGNAWNCDLQIRSNSRIDWNGRKEVKIEFGGRIKLNSCIREWKESVQNFVAVHFQFSWAGLCAFLRRIFCRVERGSSGIPAFW